MDLLDLYRGGLSLRRLWVLIRHTPGDDPMWLPINAAEKKSAVSAEKRHLLDRAAFYEKQRAAS